MAAAKTILILESNPWQDLSLNQEIRDLTGVIERARDHDAFSIETGLAVRPEDFLNLMHAHEPQIVHFCGHGSGAEGLVLQNAARRPVAVTTEALSNLFRLSAEFVDCVVLNACYSEVQAEAIVEHVDYAIGMQQTIRDDAAQYFAQGFYRALGYGKSVEVAYEWGCLSIQWMLSSEVETQTRDAVIPQRRNISRVSEAEGQKPLPEYLKPRLFKRAALGEVKLAAGEQPSGAELEELGQALEQEDALEQYREKAREFLEDRKLSALETIRLERLRKDLGLAPSDASQIVEEEMRPILKARDDYEAMLLELIELGHYPFDEEMSRELDSARLELGVPKQEAEDIEIPIFAAAEEHYQKQLLKKKKQAEEKYQEQEEYKKSRYRQELERALTAGYPPDGFVLEGLRSFQQSLGLTDEVVAKIEQPVFTKFEEVKQQQALLEQKVKEQLQEERRKQSKARQRQADVQAQQRQVWVKQKAEELRKDEQKRSEAHRRQHEEQRKQEAKPLKWRNSDFETVTLNVEMVPGLLGFGQKLKVSEQRKFGKAKYFIEDLGQGVMLEMVSIPAGNMWMGAEEGEEEDWISEHPRHQVTMPAFCIGRFAVTQAQYQAVMGTNPANFKGGDRPVGQVSWNEAKAFCEKLCGMFGRPYRLPSEAEWEYACRSGKNTPFHYGETVSTDFANYNGNYTCANEPKGQFRKQTSEVGRFPPNAFGLYDMHGNVWEWCADRWHSNYNGAPTDGMAWSSISNDKKLYVQRGGSWLTEPGYCRSAFRFYDSPSYSSHDVGFRVVCVVPHI